MKNTNTFSINTLLLLFFRMGVSIVFMVIAFGKCPPIWAASMMFGWWCLDGILGVERLISWYRKGPPELPGLDEKQYVNMGKLAELSLIGLMVETFWAWCFVFVVYLITAAIGGLPMLYAITPFILFTVLIDIYSHFRLRTLREGK